MNDAATAAHSMRMPSGLKAFLLILLLSVPGLTWLSTVGDPVAYWKYEVPSGQFAYLASKLVGLYALATFWVQLLYGVLGGRGRAMLGLELGNRFHRRIGGIVVLLVVLHSALFIGGASSRANLFASEYLIPTFSDGYYRSAITVGLLGALLVSIGALLAVARRVMPSCWRVGHWLVMPAFALACLHSLLIGSESRIQPMASLYICMGIALIAAVAVRVQLVKIPGSSPVPDGLR